MKRFIYCMAIFGMMLYSCNKNSTGKVQDVQLEDQTTTGTHQDKIQKPEEQLMAADTVARAATGNNQPSSANNNTDWDKKIIKTADLQLQLDDYKKFNATIHNSLKQFGAYIAEEKQQQTDYKIENSITIKVPVAQFDDLINSFGGDGIKVIEKNISGEDVTGEVVDTKARLQAKLAVREKYLQLLKQAKNMNEILQVQNEINSIQEDIEAADGRINYLQHASAYSTVDLDYYQYINGTTGNDEKPDFFTKLSRAFSTGATVLSDLFLFIISIWPIIIGITIFWVYVKKFRIKKA